MQTITSHPDNADTFLRIFKLTNKTKHPQYKYFYIVATDWPGMKSIPEYHLMQLNSNLTEEKRHSSAPLHRSHLAQLKCAALITSFLEPLVFFELPAIVANRCSLPSGIRAIRKINGWTNYLHQIHH